MADKGNSEPCLIGSKIVVRGQISGKQDLIVEGRVEGKVALDSRIVVEEAGAVEADVEATEATIRGELKGDVTASKVALVEAGARVSGTLRAPKVVIQDGAHFSGNVEMDVELPPGVGVRA